MMKKIITVKELAEELTDRLMKHKSVDCCKNELLSLMKMVKEKIGTEKIEVDVLE